MPLWFWLALVISMACLFCCYISPSRKGNPAKVQRIVAITWIVFRRIISFISAAFGIFCIYALWKSTGSNHEKVFGSVMIICLSLLFVYVGVVGQGSNQYGLNDDLSLYTKVKNKYGIRW
jgi:peptidoglycan/LPS O-acetylase OafA/YrhL